MKTKHKQKHFETNILKQKKANAPQSQPVLNPNTHGLKAITKLTASG
jgi:hypothetical protein